MRTKTWPQMSYEDMGIKDPSKCKHNYVPVDIGNKSERLERHHPWSCKKCNHLIFATVEKNVEVAV